jgi:hypothetical protein
MNIRYPFLLGMANLLAGAFLVISTFAWPAATTVTLGFAVSIGVLSFSLALTYAGFRSEIGGERGGVMALGLLTGAVAAWTIVATQVFATGVAHWLVFASGLAHVTLSVASLALHEISTERVVHHLEVGQAHHPAHT